MLTYCRMERSSHALLVFELFIQKRQKQIKTNKNIYNFKYVKIKQITEQKLRGCVASKTDEK